MRRRVFGHLTIFVFCVLFNISCKVSCVESRKGRPVEKVVVNKTEQIVNLDIQEGQEFVIKDIVDLNGGKVHLPANVLITFKKGGAIINGTLTGNGTRINSKYEGVLGVKLNGTWCVDKINDVAFSKNYLTDEEIICNINKIQSDTVFNEIIISRDYRVEIPQSNGYGLIMSSNSELLLNATLTIKPNDYKYYKIISIEGKDNVYIKGGKVEGDVGKHTYVEGSTSEWGMGISIMESKNVVLEDIRISKCTGDGIYINGGKETAICKYDHASKNIVIKNIVCDDNRRQGMSIIHVDGLEVLNSEFINTGLTEATNPSAGIDFEPNVSNGQNMSIRNISISNCKIFGNKGYQMGSGNAFYDGQQSSFDNIKVKNTVFDGLCYIAGDMEFFNCRMRSVTVRNSEIPVHVTFCNCTISNGEGICIMVQKPWSKYKDYERNRKYSILFDDCDIELTYNKENGSVFYYKGQNDIYDGSLIFKDCNITLPKVVKGILSLFKRSIASQVTFKNTTINSKDHPLDLAGASYENCLINCDYLLLNTVRYGKDKLYGCNINTYSEKQIMYVENNGVSGEGFDIQNCVFTNKTAPAFVVDHNVKTNTECIFRGNQIANDNSSNTLKRIKVSKK